MLHALVPLVMIFISMSVNASTLRCGSSVIGDGDHVLDVLESCGEPAIRDEYIEEVIVSYHPHPLLPLRTEVQTHLIKAWTYNFGDHMLMRHIRFRNDVVIDIQTLDKGFD